MWNVRQNRHKSILTKSFLLKTENKSQIHGQQQQLTDNIIYIHMYAHLIRVLFGNRPEINNYQTTSTYVLLVSRQFSFLHQECVTFCESQQLALSPQLLTVICRCEDPPFMHNYMYLVLANSNFLPTLLTPTLASPFPTVKKKHSPSRFPFPRSSPYSHRMNPTHAERERTPGYVLIIC